MCKRIGNTHSYWIALQANVAIIEYKNHIEYSRGSDTNALHDADTQRPSKIAICFSFDTKRHDAAAIAGVCCLQYEWQHDCIGKSSIGAALAASPVAKARAPVAATGRASTGTARALTTDSMV